MQIEHVAMYVKDLEKVKAFFVQYFGAACGPVYHNPKTDFRSYFLTFDTGPRLELMQKPNMTDAEKDFSRTGYAHIAFQLGSKESVDRLTRQLEKDGYCIVSGPRITGDGYYESCIIAIEGNLIELTK